MGCSVGWLWNGVMDGWEFESLVDGLVLWGV